MKSYEKFVAKEEIQKIHAESMKILAEVGVKFEHPDVLDLFKKHGARIDGDIVYLEEEMVMAALKQIPETFTVLSSKGDRTFGHGSLHKMPAAGNIYIQDNGTIRKMNNADIIDQFKLSDTSDIIDVGHLNAFLEEQTFTKEQKIFSMLATALKYSNKMTPYLMANTFHADDVRKAFTQGIQLIKDFEGKQEDYVSIITVNTLSPLCYDHDPLEKMIIGCEQNQPIWITPCAMPMLTAPPSVMSMLAMTNAEVVAGLTLSQLLRPGISAIYGNTSASTNLRTIQLSIGAPETVLVAYATKGLAEFYGLPCRTGGGLSDAKDFDHQSGVESMMLIQGSVDARPDVIFHACGTIGSFNVVSFEKFLLDEDTYRMTERLLRGIDCSSEKECFEMIAKVGPRGSFLHGRTPKMYREEFFTPLYFNKEDPNQWQSQGSKSLRSVAQQAVAERINSYVAPDITKEQQQLLALYLPADYQNSI
ncbi:trimethylamine methyltransferase family protein [Acetobacterium wieringae]|uniref:trimethylamine methyltransferase family protein n=1 Tax=Acetobacterium wieringae TaxID=52694 RepID=UPI003158AC22